MVAETWSTWGTSARSSRGRPKCVADWARWTSRQREPRAAANAARELDVSECLSSWRSSHWATAVVADDSSDGQLGSFRKWRHRNFAARSTGPTSETRETRGQQCGEDGQTRTSRKCLASATATGASFGPKFFGDLADDEEFPTPEESRMPGARSPVRDVRTPTSSGQSHKRLSKTRRQKLKAVAWR